jgi:hypothetical protein
MRGDFIFKNVSLLMVSAAFKNKTDKADVHKNRLENGGRDRDRTCDPFDVNEVLSR